jgi:AmmeMemoRadiSam system protein B
MIREGFFKDYFYSANSMELEDEFEEFEKRGEFEFDKKPKAIISPHAGYMYSGYTASLVYRVVSRFEYKSVAVIGPSHRIAFDGVSCFGFEKYATPFGEIEFDDELYSKIKSSFNIHSILEVHQEHSTETQFPFVKKYIKNAKMLEFVYGRINYVALAKLVEFLLNEGVLVVISTDLSHFYDLKEAERLDKICIEAIKQLDNNQFAKGCEACGLTGVMGLTECASEMGLDSIVVDYRTSADASGDESRVVGYLSAIIY